MLLVMSWIARRSSYDHFYKSFIDIIAVPLGSQFNNLIVKFNGNPATHSYKHTLTIHSTETSFKVLDQIFSDKGDAFLRSDHSLKPGPLTFELFFFLYLFSFGQFLKFGIDLWCRFFQELNLGQTCLIINRNGRFILYRSSDVVDVNVFTEHCPCIFI